MSDPLTGTTGATLAVISLTAAGLSPYADPGVVIAAFAGSVVFVLSAKEYCLAILAGLFVAAWVAGIVFADMAAAFITHITPAHVTASPSVGALVAAAFVVRVLMLVDSDMLKNWLRNRRGGSND